MGDIIVFGGLGLLGAAWLVVVVYSLFRPDKKPLIGTFESYIGRIEHLGEEQWGRLRLADDVLTFTPNGAPDGVSVPMSEVTAAEFPWGSNKFTVWFADQSWRFVAIRRAMPLSKDVAGVDGTRALKEWLRQFEGCGVRIEPEATWAEERARNGLG